MSDLFTNLNDFLNKELLPSAKKIADFSSKNLAESITEVLKKNNFFSNDSENIERNNVQSNLDKEEISDYENLNKKLDEIKENITEFEKFIANE